MQSFEKWLQYKHAEGYRGDTKEGMIDHFDNWLAELKVDTLIKFADEWMKEVLSLNSVK